MASTTEDLVKRLKELPESHARDVIIERALNGTYHDFKSEVPAPKVQLVNDLERAGFESLAFEVRSGVFDEEPTEADIERIRSEVGDEVFAMLFGGED